MSCAEGQEGWTERFRKAFVVLMSDSCIIHITGLCQIANAVKILYQASAAQH